MPTSINIDPDLLQSLDRAAMRKGITRSRLMYVILKEAMNAREEWPHGLFEKLRNSAYEEEEEKRRR